MKKCFEEEEVSAMPNAVLRKRKYPLYQMLPAGQGRRRLGLDIGLGNGEAIGDPVEQLLTGRTFFCSLYRRRRGMAQMRTCRCGKR